MGTLQGSYFSLSMPWHIAAAVRFVSFGIGGWITCIIQLWGCWDTWLQVYRSSARSIVMFAGGVLWESTPRLLFQAMIASQLVLLTWYIQTYADLCLLCPWEDTSIMWHSLMTIIGRPGSPFWTARSPRISCRGSKSLKLLWRTKQEGRSESWDWITGVSIPPRSLMDIVDRRVSRDSWQFRAEL